MVLVNYDLDGGLFYRLGWSDGREESRVGI